MMTREELAAWLRLVESPGAGPATVRRLLAAFGSPERVLGASADALRELLPDETARALRAPDARLSALADATWDWLSDSSAEAPRHVIALGDPRYPETLLQIADPPPLLYATGRAELLAATSLAIVGSRHATPQGRDNALAFARHLGARLTIVSGLALGIDAAAHEGGLASAGSTIAFVGSGLDRVYPAGNAELWRRIAARGLICSEYPLGMGPLAANFPRRNRLIAGLSVGTLVIEAALASGSLITARLAAEAGREVFAIPGSIHAPQSRGCHHLIRQGAKLVETADDVLQELRLGAGPGTPSAVAAQPPPAQDEPDADTALLEALGNDPVAFDALCARTGLPAETLAARLLALELAGRVQRLPGGLLQRRWAA